MNLYESFRSSLKNIMTSKMRTFLTMLGIIIGIGSVIIITSIGEGSRVQMNSQFETMGVGRLNVSLQRGKSVTPGDNMTKADYEAVAEIKGVKYAAGVFTSGGEIKLLDQTETKNAVLTGITGQYREIMSPNILYGRYLVDSDDESGARVCVINDTTAMSVLGVADERAVGAKVSVKTGRGTQKYTVVGIIENPNAAFERMFSNQYSETLYLPLSTVQRLSGTKQISQLSLMVEDANASQNVSEKITNRLDILHGTTDKYYVQNLTTMMNQINSIVSMITGFISAVAAISLLVGGIGVMNIMLVTVSERTREIGIRKSIGAKRGDIRVQFLIEAVILTGIGGIFGLLLGFGGGALIGSLLGVEAVLSLSSVLTAVLVSSGIGIIFGVYPANRAAKLDPIEALRYE